MLLYAVFAIEPCTCRTPLLVGLTNNITEAERIGEKSVGHYQDKDGPLSSYSIRLVELSNELATVLGYGSSQNEITDLEQRKEAEVQRTSCCARRQAYRLQVIR